MIQPTNVEVREIVSEGVKMGCLYDKELRYINYYNLTKLVRKWIEEIYCEYEMCTSSYSQNMKIFINE